MKKLLTPPKSRILLLVFMLYCSISNVLADDSGLITEQVNINVVTAGELSKRIKSDQKYKITNLKLSGYLNIDDIQFIREMAGCYYDEKKSKYDGHLKELDLQDASFVGSNKKFTVYNGGSSYTATLYNANSVGDYTFSYLPRLQKIILPDNGTSIGDYTFKGCTNLNSLLLPSGLTSIGDYAFDGCVGLTSLRLPSGLAFIDDYAFCNCSNLTNVQLPSRLTSIANGVFYGCKSLTSLELPSGLTSIGKDAFNQCVNLTSLQIPSGVTLIDDAAFFNCSSLTSLQLPSGLTSIGVCTFAYCTGLTSLEFPSGLTSIYNGAFEGCKGLTSIRVNMPNPLILDFDPFPSDLKEKCTLYVPKDSYTAYMVAPVWGDFKNIVKFNPDLITDWVTKYVGQAGTLSTVIGKDKENISKLKLTGSLNDTDVQYLEEMIRQGFLQELNLKDAQLYAIESRRFYDCKNLTSLVLPDVLQRIDKEAFYGCTGLTSISLPAGLQYMYGAFVGCTGLTSVYANMPTPLQDAHSFFNIDKSNFTLYVPKGSLNAYCNSEWNSFFNRIIEMDATGIDSVTLNPNVKEVSRYSADGQQLATPAKGLNIVKYSDGSVRKIVVK